MITDIRILQRMRNQHDWEIWKWESLSLTQRQKK